MSLAPLYIGNYMQKLDDGAASLPSGKVGIVIPALNVAQTLTEVVKTAIQKLPDATIFIIDDGSRDATNRVARKLKCTILRHNMNRGKGAALRTGFEAALGTGCELIFTLDADGQHDSTQMPKFLHKMQGEKLDIVLGNRMHHADKMPRDRYVSNRLTSLIISHLCRSKIPDSQCGYRLIRAHVLRAITLRTEHFETESELLVKAARANFRIGTIPLDTVYSDAPSYIHRLTDSIRFTRHIIYLVASRK